MSDLPTPIAPSGDLTALATQINAEHAEVIKHVQQGADHAIRAGKLLNQAKIAVRHGDWSEWLATNCRPKTSGTSSTSRTMALWCCSAARWQLFSIHLVTS